MTSVIAHQVIFILHEACQNLARNATVLDEPLAHVLFILKLCNVWPFFSAFDVPNYKPGA